VPSVSRVQARVCGAVDPPQVPLPQVYVVTLRDWVPDSSQVPEKLPHADQAVADVSSQVVPSVSRVQAPDSVDVDEPHEPASQVYTVRVRDRVPDSSHVSANPPHDDHALRSSDPHDAPSVERLHGRVSVAVTGVQPSPAQVYSVRVRLCVPVVSQTLS